MTIRLRSFFHSRSIFRFLFHYVLEAIFHNLMFECNFNSSKTVKICHKIIAFLPTYVFFFCSLLQHVFLLISFDMKNTEYNFEVLVDLKRVKCFAMIFNSSKT